MLFYEYGCKGTNKQAKSKRKANFSFAFLSLFCNFASEMKHTEKWTTALLALLAAVLLALCVRSVMHEQQKSEQPNEQNDERDS